MSKTYEWAVRGTYEKDIATAVVEVGKRLALIRVTLQRASLHLAGLEETTDLEETAKFLASYYNTLSSVLSYMGRALDHGATVDVVHDTFLEYYTEHLEILSKLSKP